MIKLLDIPKAYGSVLFVDNAWYGLLILLASFYYPNIGLAGLLAALVAYAVAYYMHFSNFGGHTQILNSLLVGLSLGAFYELNVYVLLLIVIGAVLVSLLATVMADSLWRWDGLPALSLPFVIVAGLMALAARQFSVLTDYLGFAEIDYVILTPQIDRFFAALGATFFLPNPVIGMIVFAGIVLVSRYLAFLAVTGYLTGIWLLGLMELELHPSFITWTSFAYMLVAIALGGIYTVPGVLSFIFAQLGVALTVVLVVATSDLLLIHGLPVMAIAFLGTTLVMLTAMKKRLSLAKPYLAPQPGLPEANYESARLATVRYGAVNSVPVLAPFYGIWTIYQGFDGEHTHKGPWRFALDFYITENEQSFTAMGTQLQDYFCFGAPVVSPVYGDVLRIYDLLPDNAPGEMDTVNNWGNFILIRLDTGSHVLLAHLKQGSVEVKEGERVEPGKKLANCGNSGRSPQPHLHMQVQTRAELGSPTLPFHLCSVMLKHKTGEVEYRLTSVPKVADQVSATKADEKLRHALHLPVGHQLQYEFSGSGLAKPLRRTLSVQTTLLGQMRVLSQSGASAAFEEINGVLAFYDRKGPRDLFLDMWLLGNGLLPLTESADRWHDSPTARLLPMNVLEKLLLALMRPLGAGLESQYQRAWDKKSGVWIQDATHEFNLTLLHKTVQTRSIIDPENSYQEVCLSLGAKRWQANLLEKAMLADQGIPEWKQDAFIGRVAKQDGSSEVEKQGTQT